jgi:hypothetical protein
MSLSLLAVILALTLHFTNFPQKNILELCKEIFPLIETKKNEIKQNNDKLVSLHVKVFRSKFHYMNNYLHNKISWIRSESYFHNYCTSILKYTTILNKSLILPSYIFLVSGNEFLFQMKLRLSWCLLDNSCYWCSPSMNWML